MKQIFRVGDQKMLTYEVGEDDVAAFNQKVVHHVCSTFALAREIEWATRQYVLEMKDDDEEGIGTLLEIEHLSPAFLGDSIQIESSVEEIDGSDIICSYKVHSGNRLVARGRTGQKILKKDKLNEIFLKHQSDGKE